MTTTRNARPTTYCGIPMRSRLEADLAALFDGGGIAWEYEPRRFADQGATYLPDFFTVWPSGLAEYVEAKPAHILNDGPALNATLNRMTVIWASEPDARLRVDVMRWDESRGMGGGYRWAGLLVACPTWEPMLWRVQLPEFHAQFDYKAG